ncbi:MAG: protein kinase [Planctomycetota bacterium]|nr:protein kinase [Planctomycetota bacterium]
MAATYEPYSRETRTSVRVNRRNYPIVGRLQAAGRWWPVIKRHGCLGRERHVVFDRHAGPGGDLRGLFILNRSHASRQRLNVLRRVAATCSDLPAILECRFERDHIVLIVTWVPGMTLAEYLNEARSHAVARPSPTEAVRLVRGLAHAVCQLHRHRQVIHGDLRPDNLILTTGSSRLVMIDFGSAWTTEATARRDPGDGGVAVYQAPELQTRTGTVDGRSDQFSVSAILYELLTLQLPYGGLGGSVVNFASAETAARKLVPPGRLMPRRRQLPRSLGQDIDRLVLRGLALDPEHRFATSRDWLDHLDALQTSIRVLAVAPAGPSSLTGVIEWLAGCFERLRPSNDADGKRSHD